MCLTFWVTVPKVVEVIHNTYILLFCINLSTKLYWGLWCNWTHNPFFQYMSIKINANFFLSSGGYNFKINYLKDKMGHGMWVLLNNLASSSLQYRYYFWHRSSKCYEKAVEFYPEIFKFKVFLGWNN